MGGLAWGPGPPPPPPPFVGEGRGGGRPTRAGCPQSGRKSVLANPSPEVGGGVDRRCEERAKGRSGERAPRRAAAGDPDRENAVVLRHRRGRRPPRHAAG